MIFASFATVIALRWRLRGAGSLCDRKGFHTLTELEVPEDRELDSQGTKGVVSLEPTCRALPLAWHQPFEPRCSVGGKKSRKEWASRSTGPPPRRTGLCLCVHLCVCTRVQEGISPCS